MSCYGSRFLVELIRFCLVYHIVHLYFLTMYIILLANSLRLISPSATACLCGDFNIPEIDWTTATPSSADKLASQFCNVIHDFSFSQLVQSPTRGDNVLDLVLVNDSTIVYIYKFVIAYLAVTMMLFTLIYHFYHLSSYLTVVICTIIRKLILMSLELAFPPYHGILLSLMTLIHGGRIGRISSWLLFLLMFPW